MRNKMLVLMMLIGFFAKAQSSDDNEVQDVRTSLVYGYRIHFQNLYNQLNTVESFDFRDPLQVAGFKISGILPYKINYFQAVYSFIIPLRETIKDTLKANISGYAYGLSFGKVFTSTHLDFACYGGFNFGRTAVYGNKLLLQKNPFISPKIGISPELKFGKFSIGVVGEFEIDVTSTRWKKMLFSAKDVILLERFRQSAITTLLTVRYKIEEQK